MKKTAAHTSPDPIPGSLDISLSKKRSTVDELADRVREKILSGEMPPGTRLPTTQQLAAQWGTYVPAVHAALTALTKEGLLDRRHRMGTFVKEREARLSRVGILAPSQLWQDASELLFIRELFLLLETRFLQENIRTTVWFETRQGEKTTTPIPALVKAAGRGEIQALIALNSGQYNAAWLNALPVPVTGLGRVLKHRVDFDINSFFEIALTRLQEQGCKSAGLITAVPPSHAEHVHAFRRAARRLKIQVRDAWVRNSIRYPEPHDEFGYNQFRELWAGPGRPDGLIAFPDNCAKGVMLGITTAGVRVPDQLKVVFHKNAELPFLCPIAAAMVANSSHQCVDAFVDQLTRLHAGEKCPEILLGYELIPPPKSPPK
ncbi:MAG: hypothetical protein BGO12_03870 [Verrucomicrobia bacterium 61-8]|nr:GntR family transcriptional regulator [Verrucomicrobiota bacterium]OJV23841.1 MAG: hypothetical protein BGO12_03870 [Verrucomicrobia bacterium 61-8]